MRRRGMMSRGGRDTPAGEGLRRLIGGCLAAPALAVLLGCGGGGAAIEVDGTGDARLQEVPDVDATMNRLTDQERADGWRLLFDGESLEHWRGFGRDDLPDGWAARDGMLTRVGPGGDIITRETFDDFELVAEWRVESGGNSGILYRGDELADYIYKTAPEMQVLDDAGHTDGGSPLTSAGAVYGLYPAPRGVVQPAGEWNHARIVADGAHVEHWLNGEKVAEYEQGSEEWDRLVAESKFAQWPRFGTLREGHIGLQDHGDRVEYRNLKIRPIG